MGIAAILLDPFRSAAQALVALLPLDASEQFVGLAVMGGLLMTLTLFIVPLALLGAWLEHRDRRTP
ncbi:hypothetical protein [Halomonas sp. SL1]|uniref:hypothetical protein n=1 Tax=Halomonas sp. SL1 TaxID=2137478 RepID=UPI000D161A6A|nr:hypothetical protein [Halomonas sp. SL1]RAH37435.1 hypothetical protein C9J49_011070 [Halomonas sp. SL1]